jgi:hypothetical protein
MMPKKKYYRIAREKNPKGHVFRGSGKRPLQDRFPEVEDILERRRPKGKNDRGNSIYLKEDKDFSKVGATYGQGYVHTVDPIGDVEQRDLVWIGILQKRYFPDERFRKNLQPDLTDDQVADKWWAGEGRETPNWEWVAQEVTVLDVEDDPVIVKPDSPLLNIFDKNMTK